MNKLKLVSSRESNILVSRWYEFNNYDICVRCIYKDGHLCLDAINAYSMMGFAPEISYYPSDTEKREVKINTSRSSRICSADELETILATVSKAIEVARAIEDELINQPLD